MMEFNLAEWPEHKTEVIRNDITRLVLGKRYVLETDEPRALIRAGMFLGYALTDGVTGDFVELVERLPDGWDDIYPECLFEHAIVADHYMVTFWEDDWP